MLKMNTVQLEHPMNPNVTSKEAILKECRRLIQKEGPQALTMRKVADSLGIALGSLYGYFPSKEALLLESVTSVWLDIFHNEKESFKKDDFLSLLSYFDACLNEGQNHYPGFFSLHSLSFPKGDKGEGKKQMENVFAHMKKEMLLALAKDPRIRKDAFTGLNAAEFVDWIFSLMIAIHFQKEGEFSGLLVLVQRTIY
jgi:AcrR family transcriptional regulator